MVIYGNVQNDPNFLRPKGFSLKPALTPPIPPPKGEFKGGSCSDHFRILNNVNMGLHNKKTLFRIIKLSVVLVSNFVK